MKKVILVSGMLVSSWALSAPVDITLTTTAHQYWAATRQAIETKAEHDIEIVNHTDQPQSYSYRYEYCAEENECIGIENTITVNARSTWNNHHDSIFWVNYVNRGYYKLTARTIVNSATVHEVKTSYGTVSVGG